MALVLTAVGVVWGGWLGRREAAHLGVGVGGYGLDAGVILGAGIGFGISWLHVWLAVAVICALDIATVMVVRYW